MPLNNLKKRHMVSLFRNKYYSLKHVMLIKKRYCYGYLSKRFVLRHFLLYWCFFSLDKLILPIIISSYVFMSTFYTFNMI